MLNQFTSKQRFPKNFTHPVGTKFGKWTIVGSPERKYNGIRFYPCRCECGTELLIAPNRFHRTNGCLHCNKALVKHGDSGNSKTSRIYRIWLHLFRRCGDPKAKRFEFYGGKGIRVCDEWSEYIPFRTWALANGYADHLTIDRKDNDKGYEPGNCRWATGAEQNRNVSRNIWITAFGERKIVADWVNDPRCSVGRSTFEQRVKKGWTLFDAMFTPPQRSKFERRHLGPGEQE